MSRAPFQVLVFPFRIVAERVYEYAIFRRSDLNCWQGISGGGEMQETPKEAAIREAFEEGGVPLESEWIALESTCSIPVVNVCGFLWGDSILLLKEYCFGVKVQSIDETNLSDEHLEVRWCPYSDALELLEWDSNKTALWELNHRLLVQSMKT